MQMKDSPMTRDVLLVDNQPIILEYIRSVLESAGFRVDTAPDGLSALHILEASRPDVLISDLVMPNIDGNHLCKIVRGMPQHKHMYIVVLSAIAAEESIDLAALGANACVAKGPLNSMKRHILEILSAPTLDSERIDSTSVHGLDEIFERSITRELLRSKHHSEVVLDNLSEGIFEITEEGFIIYANPSSLDLVGEPEEQLLGKNVNGLSFRVDGVPTQNILGLIEHRELAPEATIFSNGRQLSIKVLPVAENGRQTKVVLLTDITDQMEADRKIRGSLEEKEVLLKEVHHRVKNNLAMIASLITLQGNYLHDKRDVDILDQLRNRISSISLVHQQLYMSDDLAHIDFGAYVHELTGNLMESMAGGSREVELDLDIREPQMNINTAIPLGLIIAELFTNALKYAFSPGKKGTIRIELTRTDGRKQLAVSDDGVGLPADFDITRAKSLGFQIVLALSRQLQGRLRSISENGTTIIVDFPSDAASE